ncbi:hypothetical protein M5X11_03035 [Paenibacillus alginolyticus]|uniref:hypothetical protein n=1 Tax=Paenibacillus alginolyticus TaxID=59839 RepID=UPI0004040945|nr:hypothetical protein [Paenibacillus alginolyticus]MCY9663961.1 hypothetical protein [Paenibacillus alginolyticus]
MKKAMVVRIGKGIGSALIERLIGVGVDVVAYSGSRRKLTALEEALAHSPQLRTVLGDAHDPEGLLAAAGDGVDVIFCGIYLTYDENPEKARQMLEAIEMVSEKTGAKVVTIEGIYRPAGENEEALCSDARYMRLLSPELYGADVSNTIIHYQLKKIAQGKAVKLMTDPAIRREYLYVVDAAQDAVELASQDSSFGETWRLLGGPPITAEELIGIAGSVVRTIPRFERIGGWKLRLLQWHEPRAKEILDCYDGGGRNDQEYGLEYVGSGVATSYEAGIAATVSGIKAKNRQVNDRSE